MTEIIEGEIVDEHDEPGTDLEVRAESAPTLFGTADPVKVIEGATRIATPLAGIVKKQGLASAIQGKDYVRVEGWTLLGSMLGVFPVTVWTRKLEDGWEARVEARTRDGAVIGAAEAQCLRSESTWKSRDDYALRSMAQTRATSKALRQPLGFVMQLAGFEATPAEEMPRDPDPHGFAESRADNVPPAQVIFPGKKHPGMTLGDVVEIDRSYVEWIRDNAKDQAMRDAAAAVLEQPEYEDPDGIPL